MGPQSRFSSTKWTVHPATFTPYATACRWAWRPVKLGRRAGWILTIFLRECLHDCRAEDAHITGKHEEVGLLLLHGGKECMLVCLL